MLSRKNRRRATFSEKNMKNKNHFLIIIVFLGMCFLRAEFCQALMPPLDEEELNTQSNVIVLGEVVAVLPTGEIQKTECVIKTGYQAHVKVNKVIRGETGSNLFISFFDFDFQNGCVGSPDYRHRKGEKGKFYLSCQKENCRLVHWNGFIAEGEEPIFLKKN